MIGCCRRLPCRPESCRRKVLFTTWPRRRRCGRRPDQAILWQQGFSGENFVDIFGQCFRFKPQQTVARDLSATLPTVLLFTVFSVDLVELWLVRWVCKTKSWSESSRKRKNRSWRSLKRGNRMNNLKVGISHYHIHTHVKHVSYCDFYLLNFFGILIYRMYCVGNFQSQGYWSHMLWAKLLTLVHKK
jgi:hypothetical protein